MKRRIVKLPIEIKIKEDKIKYLIGNINKFVYKDFRANGGGGSPSVDHINPEDIPLVLIDVEDNSIDVDLTFRKKIKVI